MGDKTSNRRGVSMDIKRAKEELKHSLHAYFAKDKYGIYKIPVVRQRPMLLIGPPGIGKTAIMEQIAQEMKIGFVSYTITHHTRQSAVGLPFIETKVFDGKEYAVTQYTMSEILVSVQERIQQFGQKEGILFLDEINCVSETLAPMMLQFLQCKTFGNQKLPEGWVIVAAGNPPEYNKSVRDFDIVTLDRVKKMEVEENYEVWKEYAYKQNLHPAILSYLDIKKENFYRIETTIDGKQFVTARGWEDLSAILYEYEEMEITTDEQVIMQYLQHQEIAKDFANYLILFYKYQKDYDVGSILAGENVQSMVEMAKKAPFDERLSVLGLMLSKLREGFYQAFISDAYVTELFHALKQLKQKQESDKTISMIKELDVLQLGKKQVMERLKESGQLDKDTQAVKYRVMEALLEIKTFLLETEDSFEQVRMKFSEMTECREQEIAKAAEALKHAFGFLEKAFGESQEMVIFLTELTSSYYSMQFISENGSDEYYKYNKSLLFKDMEQDILQEIKQIKQMI